MFSLRNKKNYQHCLLCGVLFIVVIRIILHLFQCTLMNMSLVKRNSGLSRIVNSFPQCCGLSLAPPFTRWFQLGAL